MPVPRPCALCLDEAVCQELEKFVRRHPTEQRKALRARIVLLAADGYNNTRIARQLGIYTATARHWPLELYTLMPRCTRS